MRRKSSSLWKNFHCTRRLCLFAVQFTNFPFYVSEISFLWLRCEETISSSKVKWSTSIKVSHDFVPSEFLTLLCEERKSKWTWVCSKCVGSLRWMNEEDSLEFQFSMFLSFFSLNNFFLLLLPSLPHLLHAGVEIDSLKSHFMFASHKYFTKWQPNNCYQRLMCAFIVSFIVASSWAVEELLRGLLDLHWMGIYGDEENTFWTT